MTTYASLSPKPGSDHVTPKAQVTPRKSVTGSRPSGWGGGTGASYQVVQDIPQVPGTPLDTSGEASFGPSARADHAFDFTRIPISSSGETAAVRAAEAAASEEWHGGRPLDRSTRDYFEPRFGADFSYVRIHDDGVAHRSAALLHAEAFTRGEHVSFGQGRYSPCTTEGRILLAHELTHVVQERRGSATGLQLRSRVAAPSDAAEQEADAIARGAARPGPWPVTQRPTSVLHLTPQKKSKEPGPEIPKVTLDTVEKVFGPLTEDIVTKVFTAYGSPLGGHEGELISAFGAHRLGWVGLAIIAQESSFANQKNNRDLDERNEANPFSVHLTSPTKFPEGCKRNALLIADPGKTYEPSEKVGKKCAATGYRLPTFAESANASAKIAAKGLAAYREQGGYEKDLNARLNDILKRIKLTPK